MTVLLLMALLPMQLPPQAPPVREPPPQAPPVREEKKPEPVKPMPKPEPPAKLPTYADARDLAIKDGKPLVVFVGVEAITGPWIACQVTPREWLKLGWGSKSEVVVSVVRNGDLFGTSLPVTASAIDIQAEIERLRK